MQCKYCKSELKGAKFCPNCGAPAPVEDVFQSRNETESNRQDATYQMNEAETSNRYEMTNEPKKNSKLGKVSFFLCITWILGILGVILAMVDIRRKDGTKKTLSVLAILIFIVYTFFTIRAVMNYEADLDGQKIIAEYHMQQQESETEILPIEITVDQLYEANDQDSEKARDTYVGQYVTLTGRISTISDDEDYFFLEKVEDDISWDNVMCHINQEQLVIIKGMTKDEEVVITGAITNLESVIGYTLVVDEIISY